MSVASGLLFAPISVIWFLTLIFSAAMPSACAETNQQELVAADILKQTANVYLNCRSYTDTGIVTTAYTERGHMSTSFDKIFKTAFTRPARFRFEYSDKSTNTQPHRRRIIWCQGKEVREWLSVGPRASKSASLGEAVARATGVSAGAAHTIPALLLPGEIRGRLLTDIDHAKRIGDSRLDGTVCFRVQGDAYAQITVWIDKSTFLVRRIEDEIKLDEFRIQTTTTYKPSVDVMVPDEALDFNAPGPAL